MLRKLFLGVLFFAVGTGLMAAGAGLWFLKNGIPDLNHSPTAQVLPAVTHRYVEVPALPVVLAETAGNFEQYFECHQATCRPRRPPKSMESIRFDGTVWYFYDEDGSLHKLDGTADNTLLVAPTELVKPRDIIVSPEGSRIAYWLDDITTEGQDLTELWVYGRVDGGTFVVGEKLVAADIVTQPRWNTAGTALWFLADSGEGSQEKLEFVVAHTSPPSVKAQFTNVVVEALEQAAKLKLVDITPSGTTLAFASENTSNRHTLHIVRDGAATEIKQIAGRIAYLQWVGEGELLYAVQGRSSFEFWRYTGATHSLVGRQTGALLSARADSGGRYIAYGVSENQSTHNLRILDAASGLSRVQGQLPRWNNIGIIHVGNQDDPDIRGVTTELSDGQLIAFVESQKERITDAKAVLVRIVVTDRANTLFVDYEQADETHRLLLTVRDATHPEWAILGRYEPSGGQWQRIQGGGQDPTPLRLYEWEEAAVQWILKQSLDN